MREYAHLFDGLAAPVITTTVDDVVLSVNRPAEELYGIVAADCVGRTLDELFLVDGVPWSAHPGRAELRERGCWRGTVKHATPAGRNVAAAWTLSYISPPGGEGGIVVAVVADVTALLAAEARARHIVHHAPMGMAHLADSVIVTINHQLCRMTGRSREELVGMDTRALYANDAEFTVVDEHLRRQARIHGADTIETRWRRKDGEVIDVLIGATPLEPGAPENHFVLSAVDITERKQTQRALREKSAELDQFFSAAIDLLCIADTDGYFRRLNPEWERTLGYPLGELEGRQFLDFVHPDDVAATREAIATLAGQEVVTGFINRYRHKGGSYRFIEWRSFPAGRLIYAAARDVTERIRSEHALIESDRLNRMIAEMASDYVFHLRIEPDGGAVMDYASASFFEITGRSLAEVASTDSWSNIVHPDDLPKVMQALAQVIRERQPLEIEARSFVRGAVRWIHLYARPELDEAGKRIVGITGAAKDVSERKRLEAEQAKLQEQLQQAMKMEAIGRLAGGLAHDFNNLLTGILGNVDLALLDMDPERPLAATLREVTKAAHSAAALTHQLLAFSRKQMIEPKVLSLNDLIADLEKMLARIIGEDVALHFTPAPGLASVRIDPGQFEQVIVNLAVNARDAMPRGGILTIETANVVLDETAARSLGVPPGKYVLLAMTDTGTGMPKEVQAHLFEPFFTTKPQGRGTGLGLASIYGAVKQAGGTVEFSTEVGKGTSFRLYLPCTADVGERWTRERHAESLPTGSETVLLVEDEPTVRNLTQKTLSRLGYAVLAAGEGHEALLLAEQHGKPIDLLLTDVVMPGMSGRALAECLARTHPETKVLYTSGYAADVIGHHGVLDDGIHFIGKPYGPQALARKVRDVLTDGNA